MAWQDELTNAKKILRKGDLKEIVEYFWEYYKWPLLALLLIAMTFGSILHTKMTVKDCVLKGVILNVTGSETAGVELEQAFLTVSPIDPEQEEIVFDAGYYYSLDSDSTTVQTTYQTLQMLSAQIAAGDIDFMIGDLESMNNLAYKQYYAELSEVLSVEQLERYAPYFLYYDRAFADELRNMDTIAAVYPDPKKPELMKEPMPMFIHVSGCRALQAVYPYAEGEYVIAFVLNGKNREKTLEFLDFLMEQAK